MKVELDIATLAAQSLRADNIIKSSTARHIASGNVKRESASQVTLGEAMREKDLAKAVREAFTLRTSINVVCGMVEGLGSALDAAKAALVKEQSESDKAAHEARKAGKGAKLEAVKAA